MVSKIKGTLRRFYRRDEATGKSAFGIDTDEIDVSRNSDGLVYCEGTIPKWPIETVLYLDGTWNGNTYEPYFAKPYTDTIDVSKKLLKQIIKELKEEDDSFKISNTAIKKILEVTGIDILEFSKKEHGLETLITNLPKIDKGKLEKIYSRLTGMNESYNILEYISKFGGSISNCDRLVNLYGPSAIMRLKKDPYRAGFASGMDFYTCDRIAYDLGMDPLSIKRLEALIYEAVDNVLDKDGSTYVTQSVLKKQIKRTAKLSAYTTDPVPDAMIAATIPAMSGLVVELVTKGTRIYKKKYYEFEKIIAANLKRLDEKKKTECFKEDYIYDAEKKLGIKYSQKQREAFSVLKSSGIKIITGGPGTGKTTVINGILFMYQKMYPKNKITLCAPTGRASQRMSEITAMDASTIHRTLEFRPFANGEMKHKDANDPLDADLVVIDEMSMVDTELFSLVLPAIKKGSTVILIGDENQLQSVSSGNVLHDLIASNRFEMHRLVEIFRQKGNNTITDNAYQILNGNMKFIKDETFEIKGFETIDEAVNDVLEYFSEGLRDGYSDSLQILSPVRVEEGGTNAINLLISNRIHDGSSIKEGCFCYGKTIYHLNDKVIFERNNYDKDYFNGDIGYITEILKNGFMVKVGSDTKRITGECLRDVSLAYAITIHKSQGSESDQIVILLPDTYTHMLSRNMLFTAVTRAKRKVKINYVNSALYDSVHTIKTNKRNTGLIDKITGTKREVLN